MSIDLKDDIKKFLHNVEIDEKQIQVFKSAEEINKRIEKFTARKRDEINIINIREFCSDRYVFLNLHFFQFFSFFFINKKWIFNFPAILMKTSRVPESGLFLIDKKIQRAIFEVIYC